MSLLRNMKFSVGHRVFLRGLRRRVLSVISASEGESSHSPEKAMRDREQLRRAKTEARRTTRPNARRTRSLSNSNELNIPLNEVGRQSDETHHSSSNFLTYEKVETELQLRNRPHIKPTNDFEGLDIEKRSGRKIQNGRNLNLEVTYEKQNISDKSFGKMMTMAKSRKLRDKSEKVVLQGKRLISDAILSGVKCHTIYFSTLENLADIPFKETDAKFVKVPYAHFKSWSDLAVVPGVMGVFQKPTFGENQKFMQVDPMPLTLVCENIRDPGNLGTLLRSAAAANCEKILLLRGCVDIWEQKVLRAGAGAHFHTPIISKLNWSELPNYLTDAETIHVADSYLADSEDHLETVDDVEKYNEEYDNHLSLSYIPSLHHHNVDWTESTALVIGGETAGLSQNAFELCSERNGSRIHIPMSQGIESLNVGVSASVILFEASRQWHSRKT